MPLPRNPLDELAEELGAWVDQISTEIANSVIGGFAAPGAAQLSEDAKLAYYARQLFNPDGSPNEQGRAQEMARLGPEGFGQVWQAVLEAHPEYTPPQAMEPGGEGWESVSSYTPPGSSEPTYVNPNAEEAA